MPVTFYPGNHTYENHLGEKYISVTTLIAKYKVPFDSDYWSTYKAIKLVLEGKGSWNQYKSKAGGWDKVVAYYRQQPTHPYSDRILEVKKHFLYNWEQTGKVAREVGTAYHEKMDSSTQAKGTDNFNGYVLKVHGKTDLITTQEFERDGVYNEILVYNDKYKLAGQIDKVIKFSKKVNIRDYKTSAKIEMESFQNTMFKHPLEHIPCCNFYEYSLQMSIYAWMLEQKEYEVGNLGIEHVPDNHRLYPCTYMKQDVERLLDHYARSQNIFVSPAKGTQDYSSLTY